jgi:ribosome-associated protein
LVDILEEKKAEDILLLDIQETADFADYFLICSGTSNRMIDSLAKAVFEYTKVNKIQGKFQGEGTDGWLIGDYGDIIVHIFTPDQRDYYQLEELWSDGKTLVHLQ